MSSNVSCDIFPSPMKPLKESVKLRHRHGKIDGAFIEALHPEQFQDQADLILLQFLLQGRFKRQRRLLKYFFRFYDGGVKDIPQRGIFMAAGIFQVSDRKAAPGKSSERYW